VKLLVCGGRLVGQVAPDLGGDAAAREMARASFERKFVTNYLAKMHEETPITLVIGGSEGGAERLGVNWAGANKVAVMTWQRLKFPKSGLLSSIKLLGGKASSSNYTLETMEARNARMLAGCAPDLVLAFGGGASTQILLQDAREKGLHVVEIAIPPFSQDAL